MNRFLIFCLLTLAATQLRAETFRNPRHIPLPGNSATYGAADFNGDHRLDFYYLDSNSPYNSPQLDVILAQSNGSYVNAAPVSLSAASGGCRAYDINADGAADLVCVSPSSEAISSLSVRLGNGDGTFQSPLVTLLPGAQFPYAHALWFGPAGDLNGDGHLDLVIYDKGQQVLSFLGDGTGNFPTVRTTSLSIYGVGDSGTSILADVNSDGHLDLLLSSIAPLALLGQGDGTFIIKPPMSTYLSSQCVFADMDKDGHLDATCSAFASIGAGDVNNPDFFYSLVIFHGNPDGTFAPTPIYQSQLPYSDLLAPFAVRDLNGDGLPDILASSGDGLAIYLGQPGLKFSAPVHYAFYSIGGFNAGQIDPSLIADFDQDGHFDLTAPGANGIYIAYGRADGTFDAPPIVQSGTDIGFAAVADFNSDGIPDVVTSGSAALQLNIGKGDGTFAPSVDIQPSVLKPRYYDGVGAELLTGDFNGDGHADIIATNETADNPSTPHLFPGRGDGTFAPPILATSSINYVPTYRTTTVADINHDGRDDLIASGNGNVSSTVLNVFLSNGDGSFTVTSTPLPQGTFSYYNSAPAAADFNGDGKLDLIVPSNNTVQVLLGHGDGTFTLTSPAQSVPRVAGRSSTYIPAVVAGDFDGDGKKDFAILATSATYSGDDNDSGPTAIIVYYGNGDGTFSAPVTAATLDHGYLNLATADFNRDGIADFVMGTDSAFGMDDDYTGDAIAVVHGLPNRTFSSETNLVAGNGLSTLAVADFNHDGSPDLLFANGEYTGNAVANSFVVLMNLPVPTVFGTVAVAPEPSIAYQPITITATLYPPSESTTPLSGNVTFTIDGNPTGASPIANNVATFSVTSALSIGTHQITAYWPGDSNYPHILFSTVHTVTGIPVTIQLASSLNPVTVGQQVTLSETVTNSAGVSASTSGPSGTTTITDDGITFGTGTQISSSQPASWGFGHVFATSGQHTITATYSGDSTHSPATATLIETVNPLATTTAVQSSPNPSTYGQSVTFTATVTATPGQFLRNLLNSSIISFSGLPGGSITAPVVFSSSSSSSTVTIGFATYTTNSLPAGSYPVTATFSGNASLHSSTAATVTQIVRPAATITTLSIGPNPAYVTQTVILTAHVTGVLGNPTGTIQFLDGGTPLATAALAFGSAPFSTVFLSPGVHVITTQYSGDSSNLPSTSGPITETILPSDFTLSINPDSVTLVTGHHTTLTLTATSIGNFSDNVRLTVANIPNYATVTFTPSTLQLTPGGKATSRVYLDTDEIRGYLSQTQPKSNPFTSTTSTLAATLALIFFPLALRRRRCLPVLLALAITTTLLIGATSCSGRYPSSTPPGAYNLQITATGILIPITHTITLPLIVTK